jgi:hypothetical protein
MAGPDDDDDALDEDRVAAARLIMALRSQGIRDNRVLTAIEKLPRSLFVDEAYTAQAYDDRALPIDCGQTISQPFVVAFMTEALEVGPEHRVLEIGTGSGYQAAVLAELAHDRQRVLRGQAHAQEQKVEPVRASERLRLETIQDDLGGHPPGLQSPPERHGNAAIGFGYEDRGLGTSQSVLSSRAILSSSCISA